MAIVLFRELINPVAGVTINTGVTADSAEQDKWYDPGAGVKMTLTDPANTYLYLEAAWAGLPGGSELMEVWIIGLHTSAGDEFEDDPVKLSFPAVAAVAYKWKRRLTGLPRYFKVAIKNNTAANTTANTVKCYIEHAGAYDDA